MSDIVERLRACAEHKAMWSTGLANQAADTITALRTELRTVSDMNDVYECRLQEKEAENERLRAALKWYAEQAEGCRKLGSIGDPFRHALDLIEVKPRIQREVWVNVYPGCVGPFIFDCKEAADAQAGEPRIACVKVIIDCEEGEGL